MPSDILRYDLRVQDALRGVVREVLAETARDGLPGEHHFFVTFDTRFPGVKLSNLLRERYPEKMTIVLQYHFWDLTVTDKGFQVGLSFNNVPEKLHIPFAAVTAFYDPAVKFVLEFETAPSEPAVSVVKEAPSRAERPSGEARRGNVPAPVKPAALPAAVPAKPQPEAPAKTAKDAGDGPAEKIVSLDAFRKKP
jgi:hypothetical protein